MPPPERKKKPRDAMSVYPPRKVEIPLGGYRSTPFTQAIRCWAKLFEPACVEVAAAFSSEEWQFLWAATKGDTTAFDPEHSRPGSMIAERIERAIVFQIGLEELHKSTKIGKERAAAIAERVRQLDYLHAWAVIWALQWRADFKNGVPDGEWWTLAHRQANMGA